MITTKPMPPYNHEKALKQDHTSINTASELSARAILSEDREMSDASNAGRNAIGGASSPDQAYNPHPPISRLPLHSLPQTTDAGQVLANRTHPHFQGWREGETNSLPSSTVRGVVANQGGHAAFSNTQGKEKAKKPKSTAPARKRQSAKVVERPKGNSVTARRQKRLERNRESARLSRRRRKQYLEVLEDRVTQLSIETDQGRRDHAARAVQTVLEKRQNIVRNNPLPSSLAKLDVALSRTSSELLVLSTFHMQQLKSLSLPAHSKFVLWLTLQGDAYFRGGRASSERLSAARIGERMLMSGNDRVPPASSMWPLVCNEVGLSYDQEERVRNFQRTLLHTPSTWLDRHTARASGLMMQSFHDSLNSIAHTIRRRDSETSKGLSAEQRVKFICWAQRNSDRVKAKLEKKRVESSMAKEPEEIQLSQSHHVAANLYILNHRLQKLISTLPKHPNTFSQVALKKLSRRPSFESLGQQKEDGGGDLTREGSFPSSGSLKSLKRSSSSLSMEDPDKPHPQQVRPEDGQKEAQATLEKELGFIKSIIPRYIPPVPPAQASPVALPVAPARAYQPPYAVQQAPRPETPVSNYQQHPPMGYASTMSSLPSPPSVQSHQYPSSYPGNQQPQHYYPHHQQAFEDSTSEAFNQAQSGQKGVQPAQESQTAASEDRRTHVRKSSFLPPHLSAVPEEMFPSGDGAAEDFFISLIDDEDWAIGEGVDMDPST